MSLINDFFHIKELRKQLNAFCKDQEYQEFIDTNKQEFKNKLQEIFPEETLVEDGYWSWAKQKIDFVYPELTLFDRESQNWVAVGLVIQLYKPGQIADCASLYQICNKEDIYSVMTEAKQDITINEIIRQIEAAFKNTLSVPRP